MIRQSWDGYFMQIATVVATRSTCPRLAVGCVIAKDNRIMATGYNGAAERQKHCTEIGCLMVDDHCIRSLHAEQNAAIQMTRDQDKKLTAYITHYPCPTCANILINLGVSRIVCTSKYYNKHSDGFLFYAKVEVTEIDYVGY